MLQNMHAHFRAAIRFQKVFSNGLKFINSVMVYVHIHVMLIFHGNIHGNNWQYLLNVGIWIKCITTTHRCSNTKTCFGRSTKGVSRRGADPPFFNRTPLVSASIQKQSNTFSMTKVRCRRAVKKLLKLVKISALSWWSKLIQNVPFAIQISKISGGGGGHAPRPPSFFITF